MYASYTRVWMVLGLDDERARVEPMPWGIYPGCSHWVPLDRLTPTGLSFDIPDEGEQWEWAKQDGRKNPYVDHINLSTGMWLDADGYSTDQASVKRTPSDDRCSRCDWPLFNPWPYRPYTAIQHVVDALDEAGLDWHPYHACHNLRS